MNIKAEELVNMTQPLPALTLIDLSKIFYKKIEQARLDKNISKHKSAKIKLDLLKSCLGYNEMSFEQQDLFDKFLQE